MTKTSATQLCVLFFGFALGGLSGALATQPAAPGVQEKLVPVAPAAIVRVQEAASACGVYGLPGSPAAVALTSGRDGRPIKAAIESDIFGGDEIEACVLTGVAGLPMTGDTMRVILPVYQPVDTSEALAAR